MPNNISDLIRFEHVGTSLIGILQTNSLMGEDASGIGDAILDQMQAAGPGTKIVALDISRVTILNSLALAMFVAVQTTVIKHDVQFCLIGVAQPIKDLLVQTRLASVFRLVESRDRLPVSFDD